MARVTFALAAVLAVAVAVAAAAKADYSQHVVVRAISTRNALVPTHTRAYYAHPQARAHFFFLWDPVPFFSFPPLSRRSPALSILPTQVQLDATVKGRVAALESMPEVDVWGVRGGVVDVMVRKADLFLVDPKGEGRISVENVQELIDRTAPKAKRYVFRRARTCIQRANERATKECKESANNPESPLPRPICNAPFAPCPISLSLTFFPFGRPHPPFFSPPHSADWSVGRDGGFFEDFRTADEFEEYIDQLVGNYSSLLTKFEAGRTFEGRVINGVRLATGGSNKPNFFSQANVHAREWLAPTTSLWILTSLVEDFVNGTAPGNAIANKFDWTFVVQVNRDGYEVRDARGPPRTAPAYPA